MKIQNENHAIGKPFASINSHRTNGELSHKKGAYHHYHGTVLIYQQGYYQNDDKFLSLTVYTKGRGYYRTIIGKIYTDIGMARKAGEFAREIFSTLKS